MVPPSQVTLPEATDESSIIFDPRVVAQEGEAFREALLVLHLQRVIVGVGGGRFGGARTGPVILRHWAQQTEALNRGAIHVDGQRIGDDAHERIRHLGIQLIARVLCVGPVPDAERQRRQAGEGVKEMRAAATGIVHLHHADTDLPLQREVIPPAW